MTPRLTLVTLGVADVARARRFYEALGFKASSASQDEVAFLQMAGGVALSLFGRASLAEDAGVADAPTGFSAITLAHNVATPAEVAQVLEEAARAGGRVVRPASDAFWGGRTGYFSDPDGHLWEVAWNPHFPLDASGGLVLPD